MQRGLVAVLAISLSSTAALPQIPTKGNIEGTVVRAGSGEPVPDAHITLGRAAGPLTSGQSCPRSPSGPPTLPSATTDAQGRYVLKDIDVCNYRVTASANGYAKQDYGQRTVNGQGLSIALSAGQTTRNINITLTPAGNLSGHIRDRTGIPAVGVPVQLLRAAYNPDGQKELQMVEADKTNDRGEYRLYWITPGRYYMNAGSAAGVAIAGQTVLRGTNPVSPNQVSGESFTYTLYPGVTDINQAVAIDIPPGSDIGGIDMTVLRQQLLTVRGHIVDSRNGLSPPVVTVSLLPQGYAASFNGRYNPSDGSFEWTNVYPGSYVIQASTPETVSVAPTSVIQTTFTRPTNLARMPIELTNANLEGIVVTLITGSTLPYHVKVEGTSSPAVADMVIRLRPSMNGAISSSLSNGVSALNLVPAKNSDGSFRIDNVPPGEYRLSTVGLPEEFYLKEARYNSVDVLNNPLKYSATESGTMEVTVASGAVRIAGTALDQQSRPIGGIPVVLIPNLQRDRPELFLNATTDSNGKFLIRQVPPGDYRLYAWDGENPYSWFDPELLKKYESQGKPVHVLASSNQTIDVEALH